MTEQSQNHNPDLTNDRPGVQSVGRQRWLAGRIGKWRESDLITDDQAQAILDYESAGTTRFRLGIRFNRLIVVLSTLGAVLVGAGMISFVASNWQGIPAIAKLLLLMSGQSLTYWVGYQLQFVRGYPRIGGAIMFTAAAWFGANVFLVAQSYHLATDNPDLLIWWFIGILPLAYITRSKSITIMAVGIFTVGVSWKAVTLADGPESAFTVMGILLFGAAAIYALGMLHLSRAKLTFHAGPYLVSGALLAIGVTYILTFDEIVRNFRYRGINDFRTVSDSQFVLAAIISVIAVAALVIADRFSTRTGKSLVSRFVEPGVVALVVVVGWFGLLFPFVSQVPYIVVTNLLLVVLIFGSITLGIVNKREALVNIGIVFFVIDLSTRYIELTTDMLDTSLAFIVGGLLLLGIGYAMERGRRRLLRQFGMQVGSSTEVTDES